MAFQEIERKFLVAGDFRGEASGASRIIQGFLSSAPGRTVRVRVRGEQGFLTVKGPAQGLTRFELGVLKKNGTNMVLILKSGTSVPPEG